MLELCTARCRRGRTLLHPCAISGEIPSTSSRHIIITIFAGRMLQLCFEGSGFASETGGLMADLRTLGIFP